MPADLTRPFAESCCDGGACSDERASAQPCGCDPGARYFCQRHSLDAVKSDLHYLLKRINLGALDDNARDAFTRLADWTNS